MGLFNNNSQELLAEGRKQFENSQHWDAIHTFKKIHGKNKAEANYWIGNCYYSMYVSGYSGGRISRHKCLDKAKHYIGISAKKGNERAKILFQHISAI